jgi:hypothetical protein
MLFQIVSPYDMSCVNEQSSADAAVNQRTSVASLTIQAVRYAYTKLN